MKKLSIILGCMVTASSILYSCNSKTADNTDAKVVPVITTDTTINNVPAVVPDSLATKEKNEKEENEKDEKKENK